MSQESGILLPVQAPVAVNSPSNDKVVDELPPSNISSVPPNEACNFEPVPVPVSVPMPKTVSHCVPTLVNGSRASTSYPLPESHQDFETDIIGDIIGDDLDDLLDLEGPLESAMVST